VVRPSASTTVPTRLAASTVSLSGVLVTSLSAEPVSPTSIGLSWQLLQPPRTAVPEGIRVRYRPLKNHNVKNRDTGVLDNYLVKTVRPGDVTKFLLTGEPIISVD